MKATNNLYKAILKVKSILVVSLLLIPIWSLSQKSDYIIPHAGDTVFCKIKSIGPKKLFTVDENGETTKYKANDLKGCKYKGKQYIVGKVRGSMCLLKVVLEGDMNLVVHRKMVSTNTTNQTTNTKTYNHQYIDTYLVFLEGTPNDSFTKLGWVWRNKLAKLGSDCNGFKKKVKAEKWGAWGNENGEITDLVSYFNKNCSE